MPAVHCDVCGCNVEQNNWREHEQGRRHNANVARMQRKRPAQQQQQQQQQPSRSQQQGYGGNATAPAYVAPARRSNVASASMPPPAPAGRGRSRTGRNRPQPRPVYETISDDDYEYCDDGDDESDGISSGNLHSMRQCPACTLLNHPESTACEACGGDISHLPPVNVTLPGMPTTARACPECECQAPVDANYCFICGTALAAVPDRSGHSPAPRRPFGAPRTSLVPKSNAGASVTPVTKVPASRGRTVTTIEDDDDGLCVVCLDEPVKYAFVPCGHAALCETCNDSDWANECYICRQPTTGVMKLSPGRTSTQRAPPPAQRARTEQPAVTEDPANAGWISVRSTFPWLGGDVNAWSAFVAEIEAAAEAFVKVELGSQYPSAHIKRCQWSPQLAQRIEEGWKQLACPEGAWAGLFGWHGSTAGLSAMHEIAKNGWDPSTRSRNAHGSGEYFAVHHSQATEYAAGKRTVHGDIPLLLAFVLRGTHLKWVEDFCYICDNPSDEEVTYAVPMFMVHFTQEEPPLKWTVPRFPYRWQFGWQNDEEDDYIVYDHPTNCVLNRAMTQWYSKDGQPTVDVQMTRTRDDESEEEDAEYTMDFRSMTQTNNDTDFMRKINVQCVPATVLPRTLWMALWSDGEIDQQDQQSTGGYNRRRHDRRSRGRGGSVRSVSSSQQATAPGGYSGQFWQVADMFAQRELSAGYLRYYGAPDPRSGALIPSRKSPEKRRSYVTLQRQLMVVDYENMTLHKVTHDSSTGQDIVDQTGRPLALVES